MKAFDIEITQSNGMLAGPWRQPKPAHGRARRSGQAAIARVRRHVGEVDDIVRIDEVPRGLGGGAVRPGESKQGGDEGYRPGEARRTHLAGTIPEEDEGTQGVRA